MAEETAADSCYPVKCESLKKRSRRWGCKDCCKDFPQCTWVPAFPHEGTYKDVEKVKHLLRILAGVFLNGSPTCTPSIYIRCQNAMLATSEQTGEGDSLQPALKSMVQILEELESFLVKNCSPPTVHELRLYGLILRHVESYMFLYLIEESSKQDVVPTELLDDAVRQVGSFLADNHIAVDESVSESFGDSSSYSFDVWNGFNKLVSLLEGYVPSVSNMSVDEGVTMSGPATSSGTSDKKTVVGGCTSTSENFDSGGKGQESEGGSFDSKETKKKRKLDTGALGVHEMASVATESGAKLIAADDREKLLFYILRWLQNIGRMRSYAPPLPEEMKYYRLIWVHVMFILGFINSKLKASMPPPLRRGETNNWLFMFLGQSFESIDSIPDGWKLAVTLEAIPDLITVMKICVDHLSGNFGNKASVNRGNVVESDSESKQTEQHHQIPGFDTVTVNLDFGKLLPQNDERRATGKTRIEFLHDIVCFLKSTNWHGLPTTEERRLYARVVDHVCSSIWLYESKKWTRKKHLPSLIAESGKWSLEKQKPQVGPAASVKCDFVIKGQTTDSDRVLTGLGTDVTDGRGKTREQCLGEVVVLVEAIESAFLGCLPTAREMRCYEEIQQCMDKNLLRTAHCLMTQIFPRKHELQLHHLALTDYLAKCVLDLKRKALKLVDEECRNMLGAIIPNVDWDCGKQLIGAMSCEDQTALKALLEGRLRGTWTQRSLDLAYTVFDSASFCADIVFCRLHDSEERLDDFTQSMEYEESMDEVCHVPGFLGALLQVID